MEQDKSYPYFTNRDYWSAWCSDTLSCVHWKYSHIPAVKTGFILFLALKVINLAHSMLWEFFVPMATI